MLKAVIFDLDGVIINSEHLYHKVNKITFKKLNINVSDEEYEKLIGKTGKDVWSSIKKKYNLSHTVEELIKFENDGFIDLIMSDKDNIKPIKGIIELIKDIDNHNIPMGLASSSIRRSIEAVINLFDIKKYFKTIITGEDVSNGKPNPEIFLKTANLLKVKPEKCIVIEDSYNGVKASKEANMMCLGYKNPSSGNQDLSLADFVTEDFSEISYDKLIKIHSNAKSI
jgi:beta-phosphoglucomutase-like phosphatase (HAD superfamily)